MIHFNDYELDQFLNEDIPYEDLTTTFLKLENKPARMQIATRDDTVLCCTEEARQIFSKRGIQTTLFTPSGEFIEKSVKFLEAEGLAGNLHAVWRVIENIMGYSSGIATRTRLMIQKAMQVNSNITIATTRKTLPGAKKIILKAVLSGGGSIHRQGLSDTLLILKNHTVFFENSESLITRIVERKKLINGKPLTVEVKTTDEAKIMAKAGIDIIQFDHLTSTTTSSTVSVLKKINPSVKIAVAGGITLENVDEYAGCGADILVTSWPYYAKPADFTVTIRPIFDIF
jgi:molybdenum transport protein